MKFFLTLTIMFSSFAFAGPGNNRLPPNLLKTIVIEDQFKFSVPIHYAYLQTDTRANAQLISLNETNLNAETKKRVLSSNLLLSSSSRSQIDGNIISALSFWFEFTTISLGETDELKFKSSFETYLNTLDLPIRDNYFLDRLHLKLKFSYAPESMNELVSNLNNEEIIITGSSRIEIRGNTKNDCYANLITDLKIDAENPNKQQKYSDHKIGLDLTKLPSLNKYCL